jgi:hypothetical protein
MLYVCEAKTKEQRKLELAKSSFQFKRSMQLMNLIVRKNPIILRKMMYMKK